MVIKLKLESNLQRIASIRVAANMWLSRPIITKISNYVTRNDIELESPLDNKIKMKIKEWLIDIFEQVDLIKLPYVIKNDLLQIMKPVGENLLDYLARHTWPQKSDSLYITDREQLFPGLDVYCKHIEFDCFGKVDEVKTFLNIYNARENISELFFFYAACTYCLEDIIYSIWNKCSELTKYKIRRLFSIDLEFDERNVFQIQQYWMQIVDKNQFKLPYEITEIDALIDCVDKANTVGVKYFINKLSQDDKNRIIVPLADKIFLQRFTICMTLEIIQRQNSIDVIQHTSNLSFILAHPIAASEHTFNLFHLLAQMTEDDKNKFLIPSGKCIISLLIKEWPWKYLLLDLDYFDETYYWMIKIIVETIVDDYDFYKKIVYTDLWMISEMWKKNPNRFKESIAEICWSWDKPMMFKLEAVALVTSVIDDTDGVNKLRLEIFDGFAIHCNELIDKQKYEIVDLYVKNIL